MRKSLYKNIVFDKSALELPDEAIVEIFEYYRNWQRARSSVTNERGVDTLALKKISRRSQRAR